MSDIRRGLNVLVALLFFQFLFVNSYGEYRETSGEIWNGRWFPFGPGQADNNPVVSEMELRHPSMMTVPDPSCDDGKTNLTTDWDGSPSAYTCFLPRNMYRPSPYVPPVFQCEHIPAAYSAVHICMNTSLTYDWSIPTFGAHRPVWAQYGEYSYLPKQRWLHNLEHGAVVMLYHPCADHFEVAKLRKIVKNCLYRHIITADRYVSEQRPLVLLTWGCRFEMSYVHPPSVRMFIRKHALHAPEFISKNGLYDKALLQEAAIVSDVEDSNLCPEVSHM